MNKIDGRAKKSMQVSLPLMVCNALEIEAKRKKYRKVKLMLEEIVLRGVAHLSPKLADYRDSWIKCQQAIGMGIDYDPTQLEDINNNESSSATEANSD